VICPTEIHTRQVRLMSAHTPTSIPSTIDELVKLETRARKDKAAKTHYNTILPYVHSSLTRGRHLDRAILLAVGETGRGKSKTINTLVGMPLLSFARGNSKGSTTKVNTSTFSVTIFS
jgi:predicted GTPase